MTSHCCSLPGCYFDAAFEVWGGPDLFTPESIAHACAFDQELVMELMAEDHPVVTCHDYDPEPEKQGTARHKIV